MVQLTLQSRAVVITVRIVDVCQGGCEACGTGSTAIAGDRDVWLAKFSSQICLLTTRFPLPLTNDNMYGLYIDLLRL